MVAFCRRPRAASSMPRGARRRGFTLVEVLVALAILAIALAAVLRVVGQAGYISIALNDRTLALWIAQDRLTEHQIKPGYWPNPDTTDGKVEFGGREWRWREQVSATPNESIRRIEIEVLSDDGRQSLARLAGYVRKP